MLSLTRNATHITLMVFSWLTFIERKYLSELIYNHTLDGRCKSFSIFQWPWKLFHVIPKIAKHWGELINIKAWFNNKVEFLLRVKHGQWYQCHIWIFIKPFSFLNNLFLTRDTTWVILYLMHKAWKFHGCCNGINKIPRFYLEISCTVNRYHICVSLPGELFKNYPCIVGVTLILSLIIWSRTHSSSIKKIP